jgi:hypothetical protein
MPAMTTPGGIPKTAIAGLVRAFIFQGGRYSSDPGFVCPKLDRCEKPLGGPEKARTTAGAATETLIEHWNGSPWSIVSSPSRNAKISSLFAITVVSATNVWANEGVKFLKFSEIFQRGGVRT